MPSTHEITILALFHLLALSMVVPASGHAQTYDFPTLEQVAESYPGQKVEIEVVFHSIQRSPAVLRMLEETPLKLRGVQFKFVGSGVGHYGAGGLLGLEPLGPAEQTLAAAETQWREYFSNRMKAGQSNPAEEVSCPYADEQIATLANVPADPALELACGMRISLIWLRGTASDARVFRDEHVDSARTRLWRRSAMNAQIRL